MRRRRCLEVPRRRPRGAVGRRRRRRDRDAGAREPLLRSGRAGAPARRPLGARGRGRAGGRATSSRRGGSSAWPISPAARPTTPARSACPGRAASSTARWRCRGTSSPASTSCAGCSRPTARPPTSRSCGACCGRSRRAMPPEATGAGSSPQPSASGRRARPTAAASTWRSTSASTTHEEPVAELARLVDLHYLYFCRPEPGTLLDLDGELEREVASGLAVLGYEPERGFEEAFSPLGRDRELRGAGRAGQDRPARARAPSPAGGRRRSRDLLGRRRRRRDRRVRRRRRVEGAVRRRTRARGAARASAPARRRPGTTSATATRGWRCSRPGTPPRASCTR